MLYLRPIFVGTSVFLLGARTCHWNDDKRCFPCLIGCLWNALLFRVLQTKELTPEQNRTDFSYRLFVLLSKRGVLCVGENFPRKLSRHSIGGITQDTRLGTLASCVASLRALRWTQVWAFWETEWRPRWLKYNNQGEGIRRANQRSRQGPGRTVVYDMICVFKRPLCLICTYQKSKWILGLPFKWLYNLLYQSLPDI